MVHTLPGLSGKRVLVLGASSSIGQSIVASFAASGAQVCATVEDQAALQGFTDGLAGIGHTCVVGHLSSMADCKRMVAEAVDQLSGLDVMVASGARSRPQSEEERTTTEFRAQYQLAVGRVTMAMEAALPELARSKGNVVIVSWVQGQIPGALHVSSRVASAGVSMLSGCLALQLAQAGVRVNTVAATVTVEDFTRLAGPVAALLPKELVVKMGSVVHPLGRLAEPDDVAAAVLFLASDMAGFVTGCVIPVDGGMCLTRWNTTYMAVDRVSALASDLSKMPLAGDSEKE